ncbi:MAG: ABC transporter substrate-binding protein, partial [Desulfomonilaceae bacterium]
MKKTAGMIVWTLAIVGLLITGGWAYAAGEIKIGIVDTYSGPASTYTNDVLDAFKLAVNKINAKGGVLGKKISFVTRDDKFKVDLGLS